MAQEKDDQQTYWAEVRSDAESLQQELEQEVKSGNIDPDDVWDEASARLDQIAENEVTYYWRCRRVIRWTDNLDAIDDVGMEYDDHGATTAVCRIAYFAYRQDVSDYLDLGDLEDYDPDDDKPVKRQRTRSGRALPTHRRKKNPPKRRVDIVRSFLKETV